MSVNLELKLNVYMWKFMPGKLRKIQSSTIGPPACDTGGML